MLLYSQAATAKAITPTVVAALGITAAHPDNAYMLVACFAAVSALFVLPTYPTLLGAVQMDDTGTTRIGISGSSITLSSSPAFWRFSSPSLSVSLSVASCNPLI